MSPWSEGAPLPFSVADYIQIGCMGQHSLRIDLYGVPSGALLGTLWIWRGAVWAARDARGAGIDAFRRLVNANGVVQASGIDHEPGLRQLKGSWEPLLLDAMRLADEGKLEPLSEDTPIVCANPFDIDLDIEVAPESAPAHAQSYEEALERGVAAILRHDHAGAQAAFEDALALRPDDAIARANLARLAALSTRKEPR